MTPVLGQSVHWQVRLNLNQNLLGELIIVLRRHAERVVELTPDEWSDLQQQVWLMTARLQAAFEPDHFNYAFLQNQDRHVHLHVIPRYAGPREVAGCASRIPTTPTTTRSRRRRGTSRPRCSTSSHAASASMPLADLAERIPELMARARVPGLSVAYVEDGHLTWSGPFGRKHRDSDEPIDADTVFQAGSLSKPVFAYAVLKLVEQGVLTLDKPLASYWRASDSSDDGLAEQVTARQVLCHTTGWPNWRPPGQPLRREAAPGARFGYSGEGYVYLQRCVEHVTGQPLEALVRAAVFEPMCLPSSSYAWAAPRDAAVAASHDRDGAPSTRYVGEHPNAASSLHTTPRDFAGFLAALLTVGNEL